MVTMPFVIQCRSQSDGLGGGGIEAIEMRKRGRGEKVEISDRSALELPVEDTFDTQRSLAFSPIETSAVPGTCWCNFGVTGLGGTGHYMASK